MTTGNTRSKPTVIKIGGHQIADPDFLSDLAATIKTMTEPVVIVHGGGKEITDLQQTLGIDPRYVDGVRITDAPTLSVVTMVLAGLVNKRVVQYLLSAGVDAAGMSGVDRGLVRARQMQHADHDMGLTGSVDSVRGDVLLDLLAQGITPVIAPLCLGVDGGSPQPIYNVNADHVAGAVGGAVDAARVIFLTNVPGVLAHGERLPRLTVERTHALIDDGTINGGMIPKVKTALSVLENGVPQAVITDLDGITSHGGTIFTADRTIT